MQLKGNREHEWCGLCSSWRIITDEALLKRIREKWNMKAWTDIGKCVRYDSYVLGFEWCGEWTEEVS